MGKLFQVPSDKQVHSLSGYQSFAKRFRQTIEGVAMDDARASTCVTSLQTIVSYMLAQLYAKYILPDGTRDEMNETADAIITTFKDDLCMNTWLDQATISARASIDKV